VVMKIVAGACDGIVWLSERTTEILSATSAVFGRCSLMRTPVAFVGIGLNVPRMPSGASGLGSHMSRCEGPPASHTRITECARGLRPASAARASHLRTSGRVSPSKPAVPTLRQSRREREGVRVIGWPPDLLTAEDAEDRRGKLILRLLCVTL